MTLLWEEDVEAGQGTRQMQQPLEQVGPPLAAPAEAIVE
jgi:hypothetical protein